MTALLPGALVLFDTDTKWAQQPLRGRQGVVVSRYDSPVDGYEYAVCIGPCGKSTHTDECFSAAAFRPDELIVAPEPTRSRVEAVPSERAGSRSDGAAHGGFGVGVGPAT